MDELFDDMATDVENEETEDTEETETSEDNESPALPEVPEGAISVTDFAALLTFTEGNPYGYVVPQAVYQAVRAKRDPLPHVLVKTEDDNAPRVYVLRDPALAAWADRAARIETRGTGAGKPASKRSPEELSEAFSKVDGAVWKLEYARARRDMWDEILTDRDRTVSKYRRWMREAGISADEISDLESSTRKAFEAEVQAKLEEREAKAEAAKAKKTNGN
jgi:hypothetical protein